MTLGEFIPKLLVYLSFFLGLKCRMTESFLRCDLFNWFIEKSSYNIVSHI